MKLDEMFNALPPYVTYTPIATLDKPVAKEPSKWDRFLDFLHTRTSESPFVEGSESSFVEDINWSPIKVEPEIKKFSELSTLLYDKKLEADFDKRIKDYLYRNPNIQLSETDLDYLKKIVYLESRFKSNAVGTSGINGSKAYGYFLIHDSNFKLYNLEANSFKQDPDKLIEIGIRHYLATKKELENLKNNYDTKNLSDFLLLYGIWFTGYGGMKNYLTKGTVTTDGHATLTYAFEKAGELDGKS